MRNKSITIHQLNICFPLLNSLHSSQFIWRYSLLIRTLQLDFFWFEFMIFTSMIHVPRLHEIEKIGPWILCGDYHQYFWHTLSVETCLVVLALCITMRGIKYLERILKFTMTCPSYEAMVVTLSSRNSAECRFKRPLPEYKMKCSSPELLRRSWPLKSIYYP